VLQPTLGKELENKSVKNAWYLTYRCSMNTKTNNLCKRNKLIKNTWKNRVNEIIPVNKYHKKIKHASKLMQMMCIILRTKIVGEILKCFFVSLLFGTFKSLASLLSVLLTVEISA